MFNSKERRRRRRRRKPNWLDDDDDDTFVRSTVSGGSSSINKEFGKEWRNNSYSSTCICMYVRVIAPCGFTIRGLTEEKKAGAIWTNVVKFETSLCPGLKNNVPQNYVAILNKHILLLLLLLHKHVPHVRVSEVVKPTGWLARRGSAQRCLSSLLYMRRRVI